MLVRSATIAALLAIVATPAFSQTPDSNSTPRPRAVTRFNYRIPEMRMRINPIPRINVGEVRRRVLERTLQTRREFADRNFEMRFRAETRGRMMEDRNWQRRRDVENRLRERVRGQMNRMQVRQPLLRRRPFRNI